MSEKTEKATAYKLQKAKEQGQISKSTDVNTCVFLLVLMAVVSALWPPCLVQIKALLTHVLYLNARMPFSIDVISQLQQRLLSQLVWLWLPFASAGLLAICLSTMAQTGMVWSFKPLTPDIKRLDLIRGCKRLFSSKLLFDGLKNTLKISLTFFVLAISLRHELPTLLSFMKTTPANMPAAIMLLLTRITLQLLVVLFVFALMDKGYTRWKFAKENRMSRHELKDEYRQREGDPIIKRKTKQLQYQLRQKTASLAQVKTADVVITNPYHLAVALKYDRGLVPAPVVVCKARGELVHQIKLLAKCHNIRIIENKPLARLLYKTVPINQGIRREQFPMVALIFRELYSPQVAS